MTRTRVAAAAVTLALLAGVVLADPANCASPRRPIRVEVRAGGWYFLDTTLDRAYGFVPYAGLGIDVPVSPEVSLLAEAGFGRSEGSFSTDPTFTSGRAPVIELYPIAFGVRFRGCVPHRVELTGSAAVEVSPIRETIPPSRFQGKDGYTTRSGTATGARFTLGPEYRLPWRRIVLGLEGSLHVLEGGTDDSSWSANPTRFAWRISLSSPL